MRLDIANQEVDSHQESESLYFHIMRTADDSPTCFTTEQASAEAETMHSSQGAFSETEYIYGSAAETCYSFPLDTYHFLNLGLGIGYNELSAVAHALSEKVDIAKVKIESFEYYHELNDAFYNHYVKSKEHPFLSRYYKEIEQLFTDHFELQETALFEAIQYLLKNKNWILQEAISKTTKLSFSPHCIFFDAYSARTSPDLWEPEFIDSLLKQSNTPCVLGTYAATGVLKRCLKAHAFTIEPRKGFAFKRESTLAIKGS